MGWLLPRRPDTKEALRGQSELCKKDLQFVEGAVEEEEKIKKNKKGQSYKTPEAFTTAVEKMRKFLGENLPVRTTPRGRPPPLPAALPCGLSDSHTDAPPSLAAA